MPDICCAAGCPNRRGDKPGLRLYRIPSDRENFERRELWISAINSSYGSSGESSQWQPTLSSRICSEHFIQGAKSDDPLSCDWIPSVFSDVPATNEAQREINTEGYKRHSRMKNKRAKKKKEQDALVAPPKLSPPVPAADDKHQCDNRSCQRKVEKLQRKRNKLREENQRLKDLFTSRNIELAFEKDDEIFDAMTEITI